MNVKELREILSQYDDDALVIVNGHPDGGGYNGVSEVQEFKVYSGAGGWRGQYRDSYSIERESPINAICIS